MKPSLSVDKRLVLAVLVIRFIYAGIHILAKEAFNGGLSTFVFVFYRQAAAAIFLAPMAIIFERKRFPSVPFVVYFKMFMLSLFGIAICLNTSSLAMRFTSSSLSAATENTVPIITFILAVLFRMETIKLRKLSGITKLLGLVVFLAGIMTISFYRGPLLKSLNHHRLLGQPYSTNTDHGHVPSTRKWMIGCFLIIVSNIEWCLWLVLQGSLLKVFPSKLLFTTIQVGFSALQSFIIALVAVRDLSEWKLNFNVPLLSILYSGILVTGVSFYLQTWCIERVGPVLLATTTPLSLVITIVCVSFILGEPIQLGSVLGGALMVGGLYSLLWGKNREEAEANRLTAEDGKEGTGVKETGLQRPPV